MLEGLNNMINRISAIQKRIRKIGNLHNEFSKKLAAANGLPAKKSSKIVSTDQIKKRSAADIDKTISDARKNLLKGKLPLDKRLYGDKIYDSYIDEAAKKYKIPSALIKAVIKQESQFNPRAVSKMGAKGLMQLMPNTAKLLKVNSIFDPKQNIMGGAAYLKDMLVRYKGDLSLALAAYNAGPAAVDKYGGVPNYRETKNYIKKVLSNYMQFS